MQKMSSNISVILLLVLLTCVNGSVDFDALEDEDGFQLLIGDTQIVVHNNVQPFVFLGKGLTSFDGHHGNWKIEEEILERIPLVNYQLERADDHVTIQLSAATDSDVQVQLRLTSTEDHPLVLSMDSLPDQYDRMWFRLVAQEGEYVYGGGEQYSSLNLRGRNYPIWVREQGVGRDKHSPVTALVDVFGRAGGDYHTTYFPQPTFLSSRRYYCHLQGYNYVNLDFTHRAYHEISVLGHPEKLFFNVADSMLELVQKLGFFLGRQPPLPDWVHQGVILGVQGGTEVVLKYLATAREHNIPVSGFWIQDWSGSIYTDFGKRVFWNWQWNQTHYPDLDKHAASLKEEGVRFLVYLTPHFNMEGEVYKEANEKGFLLRHADGDTYLIDFMQFYCGTLDITNEDAVQWYKDSVIGHVLDIGISGWMADFGEYIPVDAVYQAPVDGVKTHNQYPVLWAKLNREAVEEAGRLGDVMFYMRSGGAGTQRYSTLVWHGDQNVDFSYSDGLASTIPAALSLGLSGFGVSYSDIGLYTTLDTPVETENLKAYLSLVRSEELLLRSTEIATFSPVMRTHEGNKPTLNWQIFSSERTLTAFSRLSRLFVQLAPYRKHVENENYVEAIPMQRPLFLHYEDDLETFDIDYQYLFGQDILVAPVLESGVASWEVYFPKDAWVHFFDGTEFSGPQRSTVEAPIGKPPVFYRKTSQWATLFESIRQNIDGYEYGTDTCDKDGCS